MSQNLEAALPESNPVPEFTSFGVLYGLSLSHFLNDTVQAVIPALYPLLKQSHGLTFTQIGLITLTFQMTASLLQPVVGFVTDRRPQPYSLALGMGSTLIGLLMLSQAHSLLMLLISTGLVGLGSSVFHPEAARLAILASGGRHGFAQSVFQVGGNLGTSFGPLLAAWIVMPRGQPAVAWFAVIALLAMIVMARLGIWYQQQLTIERTSTSKRAVKRAKHSLSNWQVVCAMLVLIVLMTSKYFYLVSLTNYYTFYLIEKFHVSVQTSQLCLFAFLFAVAAGTIIGGPIGDRRGRKMVICVSIFGTAPFSLALPYMNFSMTIVMSVLAGMILASAFSAVLVFAQELMPGRVGLVAGLFFGFVFGVSGVASAIIGIWADRTSITTIFEICAYIPLLGVLAVLLPNMNRRTTAPQLAA
ncbi:MFS transporter [Planctomicrobium sp. SH527]|uniref:MFS transporter n=1 Tax=Planctomicrobium sp. SH527 TaxID=3448123 RepID=UPI003F5CB9F4